MDSFSYNDSPYPVREDIKTAYRDAWKAIGSAGTWWTGAERVEIAAESRAAVDCQLCKERKQALSPFSVTGDHDTAPGCSLDPIAIDLIHRVTTDSGRLSQSYMDSVRSKGLTSEHCIELIGVVVLALSIDDFHRALGLELEPLPTPIAGDPTRVKISPDRLDYETGFFPMLKQEEATGNEADLWPAGRGANVVRALSVVPNAIRDYRQVMAAQYVDMLDLPNFKASNGSLNRMQAEVVATAVSAENECYYCASGHAAFLEGAAMSEGQNVDVRVVNDEDLANNSSIEHAAALSAFGKAVPSRDAKHIRETRDRLNDKAGPAATSDAAAVAAQFMRMNLIANSTGQPLDPRMGVMSQASRKKLGFDKFDSSDHSSQLPLVLRVLGPIIRPLAFRILPKMIERQNRKQQS